MEVIYKMTERGKRRADEEWEKVDPQIRKIVDEKIENLKKE
jgi:hypothetical protein